VSQIRYVTDDGAMFERKQDADRHEFLLKIAQELPGAQGNNLELLKRIDKLPFVSLQDLREAMGN